MKKDSVPCLETLKAKVLSYNPKAEVGLIDKAYNIAVKAHKDQKRETGEAYFTHPFEVAMILADLKSATATICAALLHDVVEETSLTTADIKKELNKEIAVIVEGLTKIDKMNFESLEDYKAENIRKVLLATTKDVRIIFVKLADRLHNMRTLATFREDKQKRIAKETLEIFAPIAHKLGMWNIKGELEDLSLRYLEPDAYFLLRSKINEKREERENATKEQIRTIKETLKEHGIDAEVNGRAKYFYSIYKKMVKKKVDFNEIYDLIGIRIITKDIPESYKALGVVHEMYKPFPKRFKDYIATPKANGYRSLHTAVMGGHGKILELQIRTEDMHRTAEDGIAAHWRYHGNERDKKFDKKISWLKQLLDWRRSSQDPVDFIDNLKFDLFDKEIVAFTPKGDPIILPENATAVDFAYMVHTNIGNHCSKSKVNGKLVPLDTKLNAGDIVEIITTKDAKPSRNWLSFVKTNKARSKIRTILGITTEPRKKDADDYEMSDKFLLDHIMVEENAPVKLSKCCYPRYKQSIVAFLTKDHKITIHKKDCPNIHALDQEKKIDVAWKEAEDAEVRTIKIKVLDQVGVLIDILREISSLGINISHVSSDAHAGSALITVKIEAVGDKKLQELFEKLRQKEAIIAASELK